jgi:tetrapyrrole methylase family protein / MazG family protein
VSDPRPPVPEGPVPSRAGGQRLMDLVKVMYRLRAPGGCPWDREQTHQSLARHLLEETHETLDAIDSGDLSRLREELGDLLLQVLFHAEIADEEGGFDIDDVAEGVTAKLVRRHPHVFGDVQAGSASEVLRNWESIKAEERGDRPLEDDIPATLPALARASKVQRRAAAFGFDWRTEEGAVAKVFEELAELQAAPPDRTEEEVGDVLFAVASLARMIGVDPESALRRTTARFSARFDEMKVRARREGVELEDLTDDELLARFRAAR